MDIFYQQNWEKLQNTKQYDVYSHNFEEIKCKTE